MRAALVLILLSVSLAAQEVTPVKPATTTLLVQVHWKGDLPKVPPLVLPPSLAASRPEEAAHCARCVAEGKLVDERLLVDAKSRGVQNIAVMVRGVTGTMEDFPTLTLDNKDGRFAPRVSFAPVGQPLTIKNSDPFQHNARLTTRGGRPFFNALLPVAGEVKTPELRVSGTYRVHCDLHPWMGAHVIATKSPFVGVSDTQGQARIGGLPPGQELELILWHETLGTARQRVALGEGAETALRLDQTVFAAPIGR